MLEHYLVPLGPYLLVTAGLAACLYALYTLKAEIEMLKQRLRCRDTALDAASSHARKEMQEIRAQLQEAEERTAQMVPPPPVRSGLNVSTRTQVLRMFRHGEHELDIAAKLGLPRSEVRLLLKVHKISVNGPAIDASAGSANADAANAVQPVTFSPAAS